MTDSSSGDDFGTEFGSESPDPFRNPESSADDPSSFDAGGPPDDDFLSSAQIQASFALSVARSWVEDHQKEVMLGAFATGVVLGTLVRD